MLVACGGGGGGGSGNGGGGAPIVMLEPLPDPLVANTDETRGYVNGTPPPSLSSTQIGRTIREIVADADTLLYDIVGGTSVTCDGTNCTYVGSHGFQVEVTTEGVSDADPPGYNEQNTAIMTHNGITVGQRLNAGRNETADDGEPSEIINFQSQTYGGWDDNNFFAIQHYTETIGNNVTFEIQTYSVGDASETRPTEGSGRWSGTMVGSHTQMNYIVQGSANIRINSFSDNTLTILSLFDIKRLDTGADVPNLDWTAVPIDADGTFASDSGDVRGTFYGADHEEIGGVFKRDNIIGAFGGIRVSQ